jgi:hypothetical protein
MKASKIASTPILVIDGEHLQMERPDGSAPALYSIAHAPAIILDASKYQFLMPNELEGRQPDSVQIIAGKHQYLCPWKPQGGRQKIHAAILRPVGSAPPFAGFMKGQTVVIGIGTTSVEGQKALFDVSWVGMANIR